MSGSALYFTAPRTVERRPIEVARVAPDEVVVETVASAISAGTELLVYRDEIPEQTPIDDALPAFDGDFSYPLRYGYSTVGRVVDCGSRVDDDWLGRTVFGFYPHQTHVTARPTELVVVDDAVEPAHAALLPTLETATNLVLDAAPMLGERVVVFGAGSIGLCTIRLLASFPLAELVVVEPVEHRREIAREFGADRVYDPTADTELGADRDFDAGDNADRDAAVGNSEPDETVVDRVGDGFDLAIELSGQPDVLNTAVDAVGYDGRVVVGSWYGSKRTSVDFGGRFHRNRIEIRSSQVSTIAPELRGRWNRDRRFETALDGLSRIDCERLITHRIPFTAAERAYELLDSSPESVLQVVLTYE